MCAGRRRGRSVGAWARRAVRSLLKACAIVMDSAQGDSNARGIPTAPFVVCKRIVCVPGFLRARRMSLNLLAGLIRMSCRPFSSSKTRSRRWPAKLELTMQQVQVYGNEHGTAQKRTGAENPRYFQDIADGRVPENTKGTYACHPPYTNSSQEHPDPTEVTFELNDTLFARAELDPVDRVHLWLGVRCCSPVTHARPTSCFRTKLTKQSRS